MFRNETTISSMNKQENSFVSIIVLEALSSVQRVSGE